MRRLDETPIDPEVEAALDAIDATLAGEAVDPRHADLAELALLLSAERPVMDEAFARSFDQKVQRRFAPQRPAAAAPRRRRWFSPAVAGLGSAALAAVVVAVVVVGGSGGSAPPVVRNGAVASAPSAIKSAAPASGRASSTSTRSTSTREGSTSASTPLAPAGAATTGGRPASVPIAGEAASGAVLQPPSNGRKIVQSAQLELTTAPNHVDAVAQEVFDVVGQYNGIVSSSTVTAASGPGGYAEFQLSVPSSSLPQTMAALSTLPAAHVASRTDTTQDVNDQYQSDVRALADARALRTSLLKQLANATTQAQIDSLTAQIHDAEASISSDQATLAQLNHRINFSQITLTINTPTVIAVPTHSGGGFTLRKAAHDAGRVLTIAAGVALIALAALVPVALLGALAWWGAAALRRRRREQTLDTV